MRKVESYEVFGVVIVGVGAALVAGARECRRGGRAFHSTSRRASASGRQRLLRGGGASSGASEATGGESSGRRCGRRGGGGEGGGPQAVRVGRREPVADRRRHDQLGHWRLPRRRTALAVRLLKRQVHTTRTSRSMCIELHFAQHYISKTSMQTECTRSRG